MPAPRSTRSSFDGLSARVLDAAAPGLFPVGSACRAARRTCPDQHRRLKELEAENRELRRANAILKTASAFFAAELDRPSPRS